MASIGYQVLPPGETGPNAPNPMPAPGTANVALCNFTGQQIKFKISGIQGTTAVNKEVNLPPYTYVWSTGWAAGNDKVLSVSTPYNTKTFCPFATCDLIAVFQT